MIPGSGGKGFGHSRPTIEYLKKAVHITAAPLTFIIRSISVCCMIGYRGKADGGLRRFGAPGCQ